MDMRKDFGFFDVPEKMHLLGDDTEHYPKTIMLGMEHEECDKTYVPFVKFRGRFYRRISMCIVPREMRGYAPSWSTGRAVCRGK